MSDKNFTDKIKEAIDSQDYGEVSKSLEKLVMEAVTDALGEIGDNVNKAADIIAGRRPIDRRPDYMKQKTHPVEKAQNPWMSDFDKMVAGYFGSKDVQEAGLYSTGGLSRVTGYLLTILGMGGVMGCIVGLLFMLVANAFIGFGSIPMIFIIVLGILFGLMAKKGIGIISKLSRFKNYLKTIGKRCMVSIRELAGNIGKSEKATLKDIQEMISDNMFIQGHLDPENKTLFVTESAFAEYTEELKKAQEKAAAEAMERTLGFERAQRERAEVESLPPEVQKILADGASYIEMFRGTNDAISDEAVSEKIAGLEVMTAKIFEYVKAHPQAATETKKLMKYYLPTTQKLLDSYRQLSEAEESGLHPEQIPNIQRSKREIEETLDTLNQAFARLFDNLYQDTSMDISADISVLHTLLAQEGLVGRDIRTKDNGNGAEKGKTEEKKADQKESEEQGQVMATH